MSNQQYSLKGITFNGCGTVILVISAFDLVVQGMQFENCGTAINAAGAMSLSVFDSTATNVGTVISMNNVGISVVIDNLETTNSGNTVVASGNTLLTGSVPVNLGV